MKLVCQGKVFFINFESSTYNNFIESIEDIGHLDLTDHFSINSLYELSQIDKLTEISESTFKLINFLDLNYLLYNYDIKLNSTINTIVELYNIKDSYEKSSDLGYDKYYRKIYKYFRKNIKYIDFNKFDIINNNNTCYYATQNGHLECLKYAHENGCPWDKSICLEASRYGHLECLKYAHENGCPWNEFTCSNASRNGHLECLKYAYNNDCPIRMMDYFVNYH